MHCPLRNPSSSEFKARDFNEVLQLFWLSRTRLYFAKTRCVIGIGRGLILPHTQLSETRRNLLNEPYFVFCKHVFSLGLTHANLSSFISYHIPTYILSSHRLEIFRYSSMPCSFTSLGLCKQPSFICIYFPFLFYLEENYSFSKNLIRYHFLSKAFPNSLNNQQLPPLCSYCPLGKPL